ncbi:hypothetical protein ACFYKT_03595 [Cytobacillus sp. FJAT-53684]|uniref:Sodium:proton antiporter n=1 Tax=Cytobacillus mangrovibacter TaxID=3299024 RepID=A0ABW6JU83_9BACI
MSRILSVLMIGLGGYFVFQYRYRVMNVLFKNPFLRRIAVSSFMGIPGVRDRMMKMVFPPGATGMK